MRKFSFILLCLLAPFLGMAQFSFDVDNSDTVKGPQNRFQLDAHAEFSTTDSATYRWVRVKKVYSNGIKSAICDNNLCYGTEDDSAVFFMDENTHFSMSCYFYPNGDCGDNSVTLKVYKVNDVAAGTAFTVFHGTSWCTTSGISSVKEFDLNISPSPATNFIRVNYGSANLKEIRVVDVLGNVLVNIQSMDVSTKIDVSDWSKGLYFVTVKEGKHVANRSFAKK